MNLRLALFTYGGIEPECHESMLRLLSSAQEHKISYDQLGDDALISRSRSIAASTFLANPTDDVLFMLDHDIQFRPSDLIKTAEKALQTKSIVGGLYAYRSTAKGSASRLLKDGVLFTPGKDELHEVEYGATGFMAIPRVALQAILAKCLNAEEPLTVRECLRTKTGMTFHDFFRCVSVKSTFVEGKWEYLSEDWAFCLRARAAGVKCYAYSLPILRHWGKYPFTLESK